MYISLFLHQDYFLWAFLGKAFYFLGFSRRTLPQQRNPEYFLCWTLDYFALIFWEYQRRLLLRSLKWKASRIPKMFVVKRAQGSTIHEWLC